MENLIFLSKRNSKNVFMTVGENFILGPITLDPCPNYHILEKLWGNWNIGLTFEI